MTEPPIVKLTKRSGTDNVGKLYELKIAALLALRCVENSRIKHAWVASNVEHAGAFDDVVLYVKDENDASTLYMIQLKHQDNPKNIPRRDFLYDVEKKKKNVNEDFSLFKCHRTYLKIKATLGEENEDGMIKVLRKVDKVFYLVYTNRPLGAEYKFINICGDDGTPLDVISGESKIYKFHNCDDFKFEDDFLSNFRLFTQQAHITQVDDLIKMELKRIENRVKIKPSDVDNLFKNYMDFMRVYVQDVKNTFETVTTTDIIKFLTSFYLNRYQVREFLLKYSINPQLSAWKEIVEGKNLVVVNSTAKHFVESYVSASIAGHVKFDNWNQCVPKTILKPIFSYLKPILIGDGNLTVSKVYEALWLQGKVPFLAQVDKFKDLKRIQSVQRLAQNCPYQVIVLTKFDLDIFDSPKCLFNLNHLDKERQNMILARPITLQKRLGVCLNNLIDKSMYAFVKCNEMIDVIMDRYNVGEAQGEKLKYYIQRSVSKVLYTSSDLEKIKSKILLRGIDRTTLENIYKKEISNISFESDLHEDDKDYHEFSFDGLKFFELQRSYKSTRGFRDNQLIQPHTLHKLANFSDFDNKWAPLDESFRQDLCVINAYPGMGKTEFFNHAALNAPVNLWVIKITLNKHNDYYDTVKKFDRSFSDHFDYFCGKNINHELTRLIFYKFVKQKNVLVLLDGFDEINTMYVEEVTLIAKSFSENGFKVWVSTRPVTKEHLEEALNTVSRTLKPLSISDQHTFLNNYYKDFGKDEKNVGTIKKFIENLLKSATDNLSETDNQFTGLPLQTKLLADVFEDDLKRILKTNDFAFDDKFDLVYLYETFLEKKNKLFNAKYRDNFVNVQQCFEEFQKLGALLDVFEENLANRFRVKEKFDERLKFYARTNLIGRDGVMWVSVTKQISFVHKTFAEFLAAKWLYENWKVENVSDFVKCRFRKGYEFVFSVFDRYVAKRLPMHLSIVSKNSELIKSNPECVGLKDECGRTVWHLFTCYLNDKESSMILDHLPENIGIEAVDELLGYNPLEYALCNKSYSTANKLCQMSEKLSLKSIDLIPTIDNILDFWTLFDRLFLRALPHFARLAILLNYKNPTKLVNENYAYQLVNYSWQPFSDVKYISTKTAHLSVASFIRNDILHNYYINKYSWELLVDFVKHKYSDDVFVAAAHGDIKDFAKTLKINETDIYNYTALQYANIHNNLPNAIYIVQKVKKLAKLKKL
ncbi:hypothetical protein FQR65_LT12396 [Abscondita terminalis]|nr:hypothetical protein FQR65_LT12396 [Abscondita terminalis]